MQFFIVLGYEEPKTEQIEEMKELMLCAGAKVRLDITFQELIQKTLEKQFNQAILSNKNQLINFLNELFLFKEKPEEEKDRPSTPLGNRHPIFISHSSYDKPFVEGLLPYFTKYNMPVWFDKINIDYGDSIIKEVQKGIKKSSAVLFFVSKNFLKSAWCNEEMESFLNIHCSGKNIKIITIVFSDIEHNNLPVFLKNKKYLKLQYNQVNEDIINELLPTLKKHLNI